MFSLCAAVIPVKTGIQRSNKLDSRSKDCGNDKTMEQVINSDAQHRGILLIKLSRK